MQAGAYVKAGPLYEAYKEWCKDNQFGLGMNATLFGNEMSKRFEKKSTKIGRVYLGIGLLTPHLNGEGLVEASDSCLMSSECPSEADGSDPGENIGEGCEGFHPVFVPNTKKGLHEGQNRVKPFTPFTSSSIVNISEPASEGTVTQNHNHVKPFTNPSTGRQYVSTVDGLGYLTGNRKEQDVTFTAAEKKERLRYKIGVFLLKEREERFYYEASTWEPRPEAIQAYEQSQVGRR